MLERELRAFAKVAHPGVVYVLRHFYKDAEESLGGIFRTEGAAMRTVYQEAERWDGRLLWWPSGYGGRWEVQVLMPSMTKKGLYRFLGRRWVIQPWEVS